MKIKHKIGNFEIKFDQKLHHTHYDEGYCSGVRFFKESFCYDVFSSALGERIVINCLKTFYSKDMPLNENTIKLIPFDINLESHK